MKLRILKTNTMLSSDYGDVVKVYTREEAIKLHPTNEKFIKNVEKAFEIVGYALPNNEEYVGGLYACEEHELGEEVTEDENSIS